MDDEKLIDLVRHNSVLFDLYHPKYMDPKFKTSVWKSIGVQMNTTDTLCKTRWVNIRDHFRRYLQKRKTKSGAAADFYKKYKYEDQLQFLVPYLGDKVRLKNVPLQEDETAMGEEDPSEEAPPGEGNETDTDQPQPSSSGFRTTFRNRHRVEPKPITLSALLMHYIIDKNDPTKSVPDHIDSFLAGIASSMRKLSPYNQHIAKGRIFAVVHELEAQELLPQHQSSASSLDYKHDSALTDQCNFS